MKKVILISLLALCSKGLSKEKSVYYEKIDSSFIEKDSGQSYRKHRFHGNGFGFESDAVSYEEFRLRFNTHFVKGNYASIYGVGASAFPFWSITDNMKLAPEFNLALDLLSTNSSSPYKYTQLNVTSKIGPRFKYKNLEIGAYAYFSDSFEGVALSGTSLQVNYTVFGF